MRIKKLLTIGAAGLMALGLSATLAACGGDDTPAEKKADGGDAKTICMINLSLGGDYFAGMDTAVGDRAKELGWEVQSYNADGDADKVLTDTQTCLATGPDGIVFSGAWVNDYPQALADIDDAGVPVVLVDRLTTTEVFTAWVGPENERMGTEVGNYLAEQLGGGGTAVIIRGGPDDNTIGIARTTGAKAAFDAAGITIEVASDFGNWNADDGKTSMENMIAKLDGKIDVVFCENDDMCLGAMAAASDAGLDNIIIGGIDGSEKAKAEIAKDGSKYLATGFNDPFVIGKKGVDVLADIFNGVNVEKMQGIESPLITAANVNDYL
ncbi:MAG: sugar ABC transporter substrate-binding protein [Micrococcales bacterium]|nr:sugar ABC transporter substrate-binding protein [Micrococcales bacterium]